MREETVGRHVLGTDGHRYRAQGDSNGEEVTYRWKRNSAYIYAADVR